MPPADHAGAFGLASLALALLIAEAAAFPANRWLNMRRRGHAVVHAQHH